MGSKGDGARKGHSRRQADRDHCATRQNRNSCRLCRIKRPRGAGCTRRTQRCYRSRRPDDRLGRAFARSARNARKGMRVADAEARAENLGILRSTAKALEGRGTTADEQNRRLDSLPYKIATAAAQRAKTVKDTKNYERFEREALKALSISARLNEREPTIHGLLAAKRARLADSLEKLKRFKEAEEQHAMATNALRDSLNNYPDIQRFRLSLVRALNHQAAFYSDRKRNKKALETYRETSKVAEKLDESGSRARLISMGNYAQLICRTGYHSGERSVPPMNLQKNSQGDTVERSVIVDKVSAG